MVEHRWPRAAFSFSLPLLVLSVCLFSGLADPAGARAAEGDPWFGRDKALHFSLSAVIAAGGYGVASLATEERPWRMGAGLALGVAAGIGKEAYDGVGSGDASWRDFTWDLLGTATGLGFASLLDWLLSR